MVLTYVRRITNNIQTKVIIGKSHILFHQNWLANRNIILELQKEIIFAIRINQIVSMNVKQYIYVKNNDLHCLCWRRKCSGCVCIPWHGVELPARTKESMLNNRFCEWNAAINCLLNVIFYISELKIHVNSHEI